MKLGFEESQTPYVSGAQNAKAWTERWVKAWAFCPNCGQQSIEQFSANQPVADFHCLECKEEYELKSQRRQFGKKVVDGAFRTMEERLRSDNNPNLILMHYDRDRFAVQNLCVVPKHFFTLDVIEKRKPLALTARRKGWTGCNILLDQIPESGKIFLVRDSRIVAKTAVLEQWTRTLFLRQRAQSSRGWLIEVMRCVEEIGKTEFRLADVYAFDERLRNLFPDNRFIHQKIRQQLQVLRDQQYLEFLGAGRYRLRSALESLPG